MRYKCYRSRAMIVSLVVIIGLLQCRIALKFKYLSRETIDAPEDHNVVAVLEKSQKQ
jgi:hypothetical protein